MWEDVLAMRLDTLKDFVDQNSWGAASISFDELHDLTGVDVDDAEGAAQLGRWAKKNDIEIEVSDRTVTFVGGGAGADRRSPMRARPAVGLVLRERFSILRTLAHAS
jgi:hypothetical protein